MSVDISLGDLSAGYEERCGSSDFAEAFDRLFGLPKSPLQGWRPDPQFVSRLSMPGGLTVDEAILAAVLSIDTQILCRMQYVDHITFASSKTSPDRSLARLAWETFDPEMSRCAVSVALCGFAQLVGRPLRREQKFAQMLEAALARAGRRRLSGSTAILKTAATRRGLPCYCVSGQHLIIGQGSRQQQLFSSLTGTTPFSAVKLSLDKRQSCRRLAALGLPVPKQVGVTSSDEAAAALGIVGVPAVVKPTKGNQGRGVTVGIRSELAARSAYQVAAAEGSGVIVEECVSGFDHRLLVVGGKFVAALVSVPSRAKGDGRRTVRELLAELNAEPDRDDVRLSPIPLDDALDMQLASQGLTLDSVPALGRIVVMGAHGHVATGGIPCDITDLVHDDNRRVAELAANSIGLEIAGIDFVTPDIKRSYRDVGGKIIEINSRPGLGMHVWPRLGTPRDVAGEILEHMFADPSAALVPTFLVAGERNTTDTINHMLDLLGRAGLERVGAVLKKGAYFRGRRIGPEPRKAQNGTALLLQNPEVESLVLAASLRRAAIYGLGVSHCDGTAILQDVADDEVLDEAGLNVLLDACGGVFVVAGGSRAAQAVVRRFGPRRAVLVSEGTGAPDVSAHLSRGGSAVVKLWEAESLYLALVGPDRVIAKELVEGGLQVQAAKLRARMYAFGLVNSSGLLTGRAIA